MHIAHPNKIERIKNKLVPKYYSRYSNTCLIWLWRDNVFKAVNHICNPLKTIVKWNTLPFLWYETHKWKKKRKENMKKNQSHCCAFLWLALGFCFVRCLSLQSWLATEITTKDKNEHKSIIIWSRCDMFGVIQNITKK